MGKFSSLLCQSSEDNIQDHCDGSPPCSLKIQAPSFFQICGPLEVSLVPQPISAVRSMFQAAGRGKR